MVVLTRLGPPEEGVRHTQHNTQVYLNERRLGVGTLYISEARVSWVHAHGEHEGKGFSLEYPHIAMHAIQRDPQHFPEENLYLIIDVRLVDSEPGTPSRYAENWTIVQFEFNANESLIYNILTQ